MSAAVAQFGQSSGNACWNRPLVPGSNPGCRVFLMSRNDSRKSEISSGFFGGRTGSLNRLENLSSLLPERVGKVEDHGGVSL